MQALGHILRVKFFYTETQSRAFDKKNFTIEYAQMEFYAPLDEGFEPVNPNDSKSTLEKSEQINKKIMCELAT